MRSYLSQACADGLRFDAYLPPSLADWLLGLIERGVFTDPSEAAFVMLGEQQELEPHVDLRAEILRRSLRASVDDPRPTISHDEFVEKIRGTASGSGRIAAADAMNQFRPATAARPPICS